MNAAEIMRLSHRQTKRFWRRYEQSGPEGLKHGNAGRQSNRAKPERFRRRVLKLVQEKYGGAVGERFDPTLAAEHLAEEDGLQVDAETVAALDAGRRSVDTRAQAQGAPSAAGSESTLRRTGADGVREVPRAAIKKMPIQVRPNPAPNHGRNRSTSGAVTKPFGFA